MTRAGGARGVALAVAGALLAPAGVARAQQSGAALDGEVAGEPGGSTLAPVSGTITPPDAERRVAIWTEPAATLIGIPAGVVAVNLGVNVSLSRGLDVIASAGVIVTPRGYGGPNAVAVEGGAVFFLTGERRMNGLFIAPKLHLAFGRTDVTASGPSLDLGIVLDVGYQFTFGAFFIAPVIGVGPLIRFPTDGSQSVTYSPYISISIVRIGVAF